MTEQEKYLEENLAKVRARMEDAARRAGRSPQEILLCAASKTQSVETVRLASRLNIDLFGENHVQELVEKYDAGAYNGKPAHMIGHLQTNKVKQVVGRAALVHSVDSPRLMAALEKEAAKKGLCQDILIEVNIGEEASKSGVAEEELPRLWDKFYRTDKARSRASGGTGVGLSIVRASAALLGGTTGAENVPGGIQFWVELPACVHVPANLSET